MLLSRWISFPGTEQCHYFFDPTTAQNGPSVLGPYGRGENQGQTERSRERKPGENQGQTERSRKRTDLYRL